MIKIRYIPTISSFTISEEIKYNSPNSIVLINKNFLNQYKFYSLNSDKNIVLQSSTLSNISNTLIGFINDDQLLFLNQTDINILSVPNGKIQTIGNITDRNFFGLLKSPFYDDNHNCLVGLSLNKTGGVEGRVLDMENQKMFTCASGFFLSHSWIVDSSYDYQKGILYTIIEVNNNSTWLSSFNIESCSFKYQLLSNLPIKINATSTGSLSNYNGTLYLAVNSDNDNSFQLFTINTETLKIGSIKQNNNFKTKSISYSLNRYYSGLVSSDYKTLLIIDLQLQSISKEIQLNGPTATTEINNYYYTFTSKSIDDPPTNYGNTGVAYTNRSSFVIFINMVWEGG
ncbi:hypothetical protein PPL_07581 [Heterostelium album PN500]|uniref:Uncharacterized protein n=1 Tax=Heterostelium pallidum (strain ATCC 26659 / Pp 5 / PN500) TaxID=670386 RepID=D3BGD0_HETP5|nr:hypothetical protein PPL_07581 [Heterostelium album PN500]EFA79530.1 hypothetical protein PPL_07581 [Heterostelium album PN500]|eukprot:XP_020431651.1 hypothetical protein PPL_07581 [Heterostelium album PN500]